MDKMSPDDILKIAAAIAVILVLILIGIAIFRRFGGEVRGKRGSRLAVTEFRELDKMRHLVLIRRDDQEHLLLIGGAQDLVIETNINSYADDYAGEPPPVHRVPPAARRMDAGVPPPAEPKLPPPARPEYDEYVDPPADPGRTLRGPGPR